LERSHSSQTTSDAADGPESRLATDAFQLAFENAAVGMAFIGPSGQVAEANRALCRILGRTKTEMLGSDWQSLVHPADVEADIELRRQVLAAESQQTGQLEKRLQHSDGSFVWVLQSVTRVRDGGGGTPYLLYQFVDIADRHRADRELRQRAQQEAAIAAFGRRAIVEEELPRLLDEAVTLIAHTFGDCFAAISETSNGAELYFKALEFSSNVSKDLRDRIDRSTLDHAGSFAGHVIRTGQPVTLSELDGESRFDVSLLRRSGVAGAVAVPLKLQNKVYGVLAAYAFSPRNFSPEDVHFLEAFAYVLSVVMDRKLVEDSVRRDRDFAESLVQTAQVAVLVLDAQGKIVRVNPYTAELLGRTTAELASADWISLLREENRTRGRKMFEAAASGGRTCNDTLQIVANDGREYEFNWSGRALVDENNAVTGVLLIGHDITELRKAQKGLLESERLAAIGQLVSGLAHESRNALQQIGACSEMLMMELDGQPEAIDLMTGIQEAEARLIRLFDDMRAYAVPPRLDRRIASLADVWRAAWSELTKARGRENAQLRENLETNDLKCEIAGFHMQKALSNILENALDASDGRVIVTIRCFDTQLDDRPALAISIHDNGPGLTPKQRETVLQPFYTTKTQGTGLGMSIVQSIVKAHGGQLDVVDSSPGAEFLVTLPRRA